MTWTEELLCVRRVTLPKLAINDPPDPREWNASLGTHCLDVDIRITLAIDQSKISKELKQDTKIVRSKALNYAWCRGIRELRLLRVSKFCHLQSASFWLNSEVSGIPAVFPSSACGLISSVHCDFTYLVEILSVYSCEEMPKSGADQVEEHLAFTESVGRSIVLLQMVDMLLRREDQYRLVSLHIICSIGAAAAWLTGDVKRVKQVDIA